MARALLARRPARRADVDGAAKTPPAAPSDKARHAFEDALDALAPLRQRVLRTLRRAIVEEAQARAIGNLTTADQLEHQEEAGRLHSEAVTDAESLRVGVARLIETVDRTLLDVVRGPQALKERSERVFLLLSELRGLRLRLRSTRDDIVRAETFLDYQESLDALGFWLDSILRIRLPRK